MLQSEGQNQKWPISGPSGYITGAMWGIRFASERVTISEVAHKWARCLHNLCHLGDPLRASAEDQSKSDPQVGRVAT